MQHDTSDSFFSHLVAYGVYSAPFLPVCTGPTTTGTKLAISGSARGRNSRIFSGRSWVCKLTTRRPRWSISRWAHVLCRQLASSPCSIDRYICIPKFIYGVLRAMRERVIVTCCFFCRWCFVGRLRTRCSLHEHRAANFGANIL